MANVNKIHLVAPTKEVEDSADPVEVDAGGLVTDNLDDIENAAALRHEEVMQALADSRERIMQTLKRD
jgi:hypothetical protein